MKVEAMSNLFAALDRRLIFGAALLVGGKASIAGADPLPSWNDRDTKAAIIEFVEGVTAMNEQP
jgi:hypothetical protein